MEKWDSILQNQFLAFKLYYITIFDKVTETVTWTLISLAPNFSLLTNVGRQFKCYCKYFWKVRRVIKEPYSSTTLNTNLHTYTCNAQMNANVVLKAYPLVAECTPHHTLPLAITINDTTFLPCEEGKQWSLCTTIYCTYFITHIIWQYLL
jgi:hypothetical protein